MPDKSDNPVNIESSEDSQSFLAAKARSDRVWQDLKTNASKYRLLTGDRPTGPLHIGHYFGTLANRVKIQEMGVETFIVIADYQVLTDRDSYKEIPGNVKEILLDYLACGLDPKSDKTWIFRHSHVPELNQLLLPFLTLVSVPELERNPTVKDEIRAAQLKVISGAMLTYPVHQAADILFCKGDLVPVGKDQLPHLEISRKIARRFNERFAPKKPVFKEPTALLSEVPMIQGLDGNDKMSKSRGNAIILSWSADQTAKAIKKATTDSERNITYDPENRPEVANLLRIISLCTGEDPKAIASSIGEGGGGQLKAKLTEAINDFLAPIRARRLELASNLDYLNEVLAQGTEKARQEGAKTLQEVRKSMLMESI